MNAVWILAILLGVLFIWSLYMWRVTRDRMIIAEAELERAQNEILKLTDAKEDAKESPETELVEGDIFDGLVHKKYHSVAGRKTALYSISDNWPEFKTNAELFQFAEKTLGKMEDPKVADIPPYGEVTTVDKYTALKIVAQNLVKMILETIKTKEGYVPLKKMKEEEDD